MQNENTSGHADRNARMMLHYGRVIPEKEILSAIKKVSLQDLQKSADSLFSQKPTVAALGPIKHLMSYQDICSALKG